MNHLDDIAELFSSLFEFFSPRTRLLIVGISLLVFTVVLCYLFCR